MKKAFTLAEVLITLSIVGAIAFLTIPSAVKNYNNRIYAVSLKKINAQINDAVRSMIMDEHADSAIKNEAGDEIIPGLLGTSIYADNDCTDNKEQGVCYFFKKYFRYDSLCESARDGVCVSTSYTSQAGATSSAVEPCIRTNTGAAVCMMKNVKTDQIEVFIDVNGTSGPNIVGLDAFGGYLTVDANSRLKDHSDKADDCSKDSNYADVSKIINYTAGCLYKVIKNGWTITD